MSMKRTLSRRAVLASSAAAAGAALLPASAQARSLALGLAAVPTSVDPHYHDSQINRGLSAHVFDRLVHQDAAQRLVPGLAASWRMLDDVTWEFTLRRGVHFHDGAPFTAADVAASLRRAPEVRNSPASFVLYTRAIESVTVVDAHTLRIRTTMPWPLFAHDLTAVAIVPQSVEAATTADFNSGRAMIGTGPFRFRSWVPGEEVVLEGNPEWWGGPVAWSQTRLAFLPNPNTRTVALTTRRIQLINGVPPSSVEYLARNPAITLARRVSNQVIYLQLDVARDQSPFVTARGGGAIDSPLRDRRVRQALSLAINRQALIDRLLDGLGVPAAGLLPDERPSAGGRLGPPRFDPDRARALLQEAGHAGGFALVLQGASDNIVGADDLLSAVASMLSRIGVEARVELQPRAIYAARTARREFAVALFQRSFPTGEPSNALRAILATPDPVLGTGSLNRGGYSNPAFDALVARAMATMDEAAREVLLFEATRLAMDDGALIALYHPVNVWAMTRDVTMEVRADDYTFAHDIRPRG